MWNNSDTFRELTQENTKYILSEFISNNTETFRGILPQGTFCQSSYKIILTLSESYYQTILHTFFRVYIIQ